MGAKQEVGSRRKHIVELAGVCFHRSGRVLLSSVNWRIDAGCHWALLGANGSGKTTLLKILTGYEWPTRGEVRVLGRRFGECNLPRLRKIIGWVTVGATGHFPPTDIALDVVVSGFDASTGLYRQFTDREYARARNALAHMNAEAIADRPYGILSQGEQQRVAIARALVHRPALLILDEPCVGLDPVARELFLADLGRLARGRNAPTLIFVTHHLEELGPWISRALILKQGAALAAGPLPTILTDDVLSRAFERSCRVSFDGARYHLRLDGPRARGN
jgi:iron complex transport system ATP-binding protein